MRFIFFLSALILMTIEGFAKIEDWDRFNSSLLIEVTRPNGVFTCTGVAVDAGTLITAAHCLEGSITKVRVFTQQEYNPKNAALEVKEYKIHPDYNPSKSKFVNDVAKITMSQKLPSFIRIHPVFKGELILGAIYRFGFGGRDKKNIRTVITPTFRRLDLANNVIELNDQFSKNGDSGGPIFIENGNKIEILAVHSTFSHGPLGNFSYNPLLAKYLSWIYQN